MIFHTIIRFNLKTVVPWPQLSSPYGAFRLANSDVHFLHTFRPKNKPGSGWIAKEMFQEAYEEDCIVTNLAPLATSEDEDTNELVTFD